MEQILRLFCIKRDNKKGCAFSAHPFLEGENMLEVCFDLSVEGLLKSAKINFLAMTTEEYFH